MLIYDEQLPVLDDEFEGNEVALLAVRGRRRDKHFRQNYAWAKHAADLGELDKITVVVEVDGTDVVHTVNAVRDALTGAALHGVAEFSVLPERASYARGVGPVREALKELEPVAVVEPEIVPVDVVVVTNDAPVIDWRSLQNKDTQEV